MSYQMLHEARCLDSLQKQLFWFDDFLGDQIQDEWTLIVAGGGAGAVVDNEAGGVYRFTLNALNATARIDWGNIRSLLVTKNVCMEVRAKFSASNADRYCELELYNDSNNTLMIRITPPAGNDIWIRCMAGGVDTTFQIDTDPGTDYNLWRILTSTQGGNHVHFYRNNVELANSPIVANIPALYLQPSCYGLNIAGGGAFSQSFDYVAVRQDR